MTDWNSAGIAAIVAGVVLSQLREDPELRDALDARQLLTIGLDRIREDQCPLCGAVVRPGVGKQV